MFAKYLRWARPILETVLNLKNTHHGVWGPFFDFVRPYVGLSGMWLPMGLWCTLPLFLQTGRLDKIKTVTHLPVQFIRSQWEEGGQQTAAAELDVNIPVPSKTFAGDRFHWKIGLEGSCVMTVLLDFN